MCSLNDVDGNGENLFLQQKNAIIGDKCRSCENKALVVLRKKDIYCRDCFLATEIHKFRAALGKTKMMKPQDKVLCAFSGSQSSVALLHLLHSGITEEQHKKFLFSVCVLFIDEGALLNMEVGKRQEIVESVKNIVSTYKFPISITTLSECFSESPVIDSSLKVCEKNDVQLVTMFSNLKCMTSKEDLLHVLRQKLLLNAAKQLNCNKIFTAEVGTDLAVKLLSSFSLGRGDQASFETSFHDSRHPHCRILRPLRDFTRKEITYYNIFHCLEEIIYPSLTTMLSSNVSIQKLTEKFILDLENGFPSTVYTIFRTGEKLSASTVEGEGVDTCLLCDDKIRTTNNKKNYSAIEAANFSRNVSRKKISVCTSNEKKGCCGSCSHEDLQIPKNLELERFMCYGCTLIVRDLKNINCLPEKMLHSAAQKRDFETMRETISDFLIDES